MTVLTGVLLVIILSGCASSTIKPVTTFAEPGYENASFKNVLVIGVAGSYENRARFERIMAARLNASGATGTAYYTVIGRNREITRSEVSDVVRARGFDSVVLTRVLSLESDVSEQSGKSTAKVTRRDDETPIDLFRYDYEVLNNPSKISIDTTVVLSTEVFSAVDEKRVFAMETTVLHKENIGLLIDDAVEKIVTHLKKDGIIGE